MSSPTASKRAVGRGNVALHISTGVPKSASGGVQRLPWREIVLEHLLEERTCDLREHRMLFHPPGNAWRLSGTSRARGKPQGDKGVVVGEAHVRDKALHHCLRT